jgi:integrase
MDAEAWLKRQSRLVEAGTWEPDTDGTHTFNGYAKEWIANRELKPSTVEHYTKLLNVHLKPAFGTMMLDTITVAKVKSWHRGLDLPPTMKAHTYSLLRAILQTAYQDDLIPANPCRIRGASSSKRVSTTELPTAVQVHELADEMGITRNNDESTRTLADGKYRVMTLVAAWCGLRFGELTELRRADLVLGDDGAPVKIRVRRGVVRVNGEFLVQTPKSSAGVRDVAIPPHIRVDVEEYLDALGGGSDQLLFPGSRNGQHMAPSALYKPFYRARERVGLPSLRWHDLRHFAATTAAQTGATLAELQGFAGHSTTQAAMRYQHAAADANERIAEAMSNVVPMHRKAV